MHDISDGGLSIAVIEMALPTAYGAKLEALDYVQLFAEDQARYVLSATPARAMAILAGALEHGVEAAIIGEVSAAPTLAIGSAAAISLEDLRIAHEGWFANFMNG